MGRRSTERLLMVCSLLELLALAMWIGGLVVIVAAVIPAVFNTIGMEAGGKFLGRVFAGYNRVVAVGIVVLVATAAWRVWAGMHGVAEARLSRAELLVTTTMIVIASVITLALTPKTVALQQAAFAARGEAERKAAYDAFFSVHHVARVLYLLNLGLAVVLSAVKLRQWMRLES